MSFNKNTISTNSNSGFCNSFNHIGSAASNTSNLIGLLQRMRNIQNGSCKFLHRRNSSKINNHILITKHCSSICDHNFLIIAVQHFLNGVFHTFRTHKLPFFQVYYFSSICGSDNQVGLTHQKSRNLQNIHILSCHCCIFVGVNVCNYRNIKCF